MKPLGEFEVWFVTGSQDMYGDATLRQVAENARRVATTLDGLESIPVRVVHRPVVTSSESIAATLLEANATDACVGVILWMHTFSPARMWIAGLQAIRKPLLHLHTQFNRDLPWGEIDMDFMNLNQSAHGDREFGFIETRLRTARKTVVGHWEDPVVAARIGSWARARWRERLPTAYTSAARASAPATSPVTGSAWPAQTALGPNAASLRIDARASSVSWLKAACGTPAGCLRPVWGSIV